MMSLVNNDIEANFSRLSNDNLENNPNPSNNSTTTVKLATTSFESDDDKTGIYCLKFTFIFLILLFGLPMVICDLYYAYNDNSCVTSHVDRISINLKEYLLVSGLLSGCFLIIVILIILSYNKNLNAFLITIGTILFIFISIFNTVWNIIGGVIFWEYMDNSLCSNSIFNYVFASLIIKYVCCVLSLFSNNKKKD